MSERFMVSKELKFEAAHRLINGYPGNCKNIHGHSYIAIVEMGLSSKATLNKYGFVKDFGDFKDLRKWVDDNWDHAFLVNIADDSMIRFLREEEQRHYIFKDNPTAEHMCIILFDIASQILNDVCSTVTSVKIYETTTSEAVYRPSLVSQYAHRE